MQLALNRRHIHGAHYRSAHPSRRPFHEPAVLDVEDAVGQPDDLGAVCDHQQLLAGAAGQAVQQFEHLLAGFFIQVAGRLIGQHQQRVVDSARATAMRCCSPPESRSG